MRDLHCDCGKIIGEADGDATVEIICKWCRRKMRFEINGERIKVTVINRRKPGPKERKA